MTASAEFTFSGARFLLSAVPDASRAKHLRSLVDSALERGDRHLVVDCSEWREVEVKTLSSLIQCAAACAARGAKFEVTNMSSELLTHVRDLHLADRLGLS